MRPKPLTHTDLMAMQQTQDYYSNLMSSFVQQNPINVSNLMPLSLSQQQQICYPTISSCEKILNSIEETNGRLNSDLEQYLGENKSINGKTIESGRINTSVRFSLISCQPELKALANGFMMDLTCTELDIFP
jgi:hypothetical protein